MNRFFNESPNFEGKKLCIYNCNAIAFNDSEGLLAMLAGWLLNFLVVSIMKVYSVHACARVCMFL